VYQDHGASMGFIFSWFSSCSRPVGRPNGWFTMMVVMALLTTFVTTPILMAMKIQPRRDDLAA
jgi:hypothetical protein